jgi:hypothetical protein
LALSFQVTVPTIDHIEIFQLAVFLLDHIGGAAQLLEFIFEYLHYRQFLKSFGISDKENLVISEPTYLTMNLINSSGVALFFALEKNVQQIGHVVYCVQTFWNSVYATRLQQV